MLKFNFNFNIIELTMAKEIKVALAGQPNVGKSSLIRSIAGADVRVGNWPGITVEKHEATLEYKGYRIHFVDLPGIYNLSPYTLEERIARDYILFEKPDLIVNVIESPQLERNLFLTSQLLELEKPIVIALNMWDEFTELGFKLDIPSLERALNVRAVPVIGKTGWNKDKLLDAIIETYEKGTKPRYFKFSKLVEEILEKVDNQIKEQPFYKEFPKRWLDIKVLEEDEYLAEYLEKKYNFDLKRCCHKERHYLSEAYNMPPDEVITSERYKAISALVSAILKKPKQLKQKLQDRIDNILLNPFIGIPFFFLVMFITFKITFDVSAPYMDWLDSFINDFIGKYMLIGLSALGASDWLTSFVKDGIIGGIGFFATFIPVLMFMYLALGFLEQSGYFARAASVFDAALRPFGLTGKSTVPMILGFGCNVPAILATRTLENVFLRKLTALIIPFMSCSARLPVYALFATAFFPGHEAAAIFSMYILGIVVALLVAFILSRSLYKKVLEIPFTVEFPPYRLPNFKDILRSMWTPVWEFIHRAGTVIFFANLAVWAMLNIPYGVPPKDTILGKFSQTIQPIFKPAGFGNHWENVAVLVPGFLAKEIVITSYGTILGVEEGGKIEIPKANFLEDLKEQIVGFIKAVVDSVKLFVNNIIPSAFEVEKPESEMVKKVQAFFTAASALAFMVFVLLYTPCAATVAVMWQEFGWRFALFSIAINLSVAWILSTLFYQLFSLIW
jgi:ferrous iron transport protein B